MDPTDPQFWQSLGVPQAFAGFLTLVVLGLMAMLGKQTKNAESERQEWLKIQLLVQQLAHLPADVEQIKDNQSEFSDALSDIRETQAAMARDIEWLRMVRGRET